MAQLSQAQKDRIAKSNGFSSWEQYKNWSARRDESSGGTAKGSIAGAAKRGARETGTNKPPSRGNALSWHPATLLKHVADKFRSARGK